MDGGRIARVLTSRSTGRDGLRADVCACRIRLWACPGHVHSVAAACVQISSGCDFQLGVRPAGPRPRRGRQHEPGPPGGYRLAARDRGARRGRLPFRGAGDLRRLRRRRHLLRHLRLSDHGNHFGRDRKRPILVRPLLRAPRTAAAARPLCDGRMCCDSGVARAAQLRTRRVLRVCRRRRHLHLERLLLAAVRLFRPCGGREAAAAHLVARGRGAVLSGASGRRLGGAAAGAAAQAGAAWGPGAVRRGVVCARLALVA